jgi:hypothetical protein
LRCYVYVCLFPFIEQMRNNVSDNLNLSQFQRFT